MQDACQIITLNYLHEECVGKGHGFGIGSVLVLEVVLTNHV